MHPRTLTISTLIALAAPAAALAGPTTPPPGPITSTMKTLTEVEPRIAINAINTPGDANSLFKIDSPGSYYLTGDISGVAGKSGIEIAASEVTLDLNGFSLLGNVGTLSGIVVSDADRANISVQNGMITFWGQHGIDFATAAAQRCCVRNILSDDNGGRGIRVYNFSRVIDCTTDYNVSIGIDAYSDCSVINCHTNNNNSTGIDTATNCIITGCIATANGNRGINAGGACTISGCLAAANSDFGIATTTKTRVNANNCTSNGDASGGGGISVSGAGNRLESNSCASNAQGIVVTGANNLIVKNTCAGNSVNWAIGLNNVYGPIINRSAPSSFGAYGDAAPSTLGTTDPNANFTH